MEHGFVVRRLLLPADENPPEAVHPGSDAFDDPASGAATAGAFGGLLFATRLDVRSVATSAGFATEDDWFDFQLENDPRFLKKIEESRASIRAGEGISWEQVKREDDERSG